MSVDYDLAVIGGGIHGVGVAQAAVAAGYSVVLLEQYTTLAQGTSSRSSKLIHGGLRYLENFDLSLVAECLRERKYLLENAPSIVKLRPVYIPVYTHSRRSPWLIRAGLSIYALLGKLKKESRFCQIRNLNDLRIRQLNKENLLAVFRYYEAQTDDSVLTVAVMRSAQELGAELKLGSPVEKVKLEEDHCKVYYRDDASLSKLSAKCVVNAAGPWANSFLSKVSPVQKPVEVDLVQGTHIILPIELGEEIFYVESPADGRPVFVMPWYGDTMIGTTELLFERDPGETRPTKSEIEYLLETFYAYFPEIPKVDINDVESFSGLRVLPRSKENANKRSRETIFHRDRKDKPRIISIFGGKLTSYRATAQNTLDRLQDSLPAKLKFADTTKIKLFE